MATLERPTKAPVSGSLLQGKYLQPWRSPKGKLKGLLLQTPAETVVVKLPKYLRPMLVRELVPETWLQVQAERQGDRWEAINVLPVPAAEVPTLAAALAAAPAIAAVTNPTEAAQAKSTANLRLQVCQKGKCCKQGSRELTRWLQTEAAQNPAWSHVEIEPTGCLKACKQGPNIRVSPGKDLVHYVDRTTVQRLVDQRSP
jgi:(2Fe-2S) ferredoxin